MKWLRRLLGLDCCGEWTRWEYKEAVFGRPVRNANEILAANAHGKYEFTRHWQERKCSRCGRIQQGRLEY